MSVHNAYLTFMMSGFYFGVYIFTWLFFGSPFFFLFFTSIYFHLFPFLILFSSFYFPFSFLIQNLVAYALCSVCIIFNWFWAKNRLKTVPPVWLSFIFGDLVMIGVRSSYLHRNDCHMIWNPNQKIQPSFSVAQFWRRIYATLQQLIEWVPQITNTIFVTFVSR